LQEIAGGDEGVGGGHMVHLVSGMNGWLAMRYFLEACFYGYRDCNQILGCCIVRDWRCLNIPEEFGWRPCR